MKPKDDSNLCNFSFICLYTPNIQTLIIIFTSFCFFFYKCIATLCDKVYKLLRHPSEQNTDSLCTSLNTVLSLCLLIPDRKMDN